MTGPRNESKEAKLDISALQELQLSVDQIRKVIAPILKHEELLRNANAKLLEASIDEFRQFYSKLAEPHPSPALLQKFIKLCNRHINQLNPKNFDYQLSPDDQALANNIYRELTAVMEGIQKDIQDIRFDSVTLSEYEQRLVADIVDNKLTADARGRKNRPLSESDEGERELHVDRYQTTELTRLGVNLDQIGPIKQDIKNHLADIQGSYIDQLNGYLSQQMGTPGFADNEKYQLALQLRDDLNIIKNTIEAEKSIINKLALFDRFHERFNKAANDLIQIKKNLDAKNHPEAKNLESKNVGENKLEQSWKSTFHHFFKGTSLTGIVVNYQKDEATLRSAINQIKEQAKQYRYKSKPPS